MGNGMPFAAIAEEVFITREKILEAVPHLTLKEASDTALDIVLERNRACEIYGPGEVLTLLREMDERNATL